MHSNIAQIASACALREFPESVNFHLLNACNMRCKHCFATFPSVRVPQLRSERIQLTATLAQHFKKITFVGGEPTLVPYLAELIGTAKANGAITCLVTNGSLMTIKQIDELNVDWFALSIDSADPETHRRMGRAVKEVPCSPERYLQLAQAVRDAGKFLKINTVVSKQNVLEDMSEFILDLRPHRWKVFQVLPIFGENDRWIKPLLISKQEFDEYVARHQVKLTGSEVTVVPEDNQLMTGSYAMVDPLGRFFDNVDGDLRYGPPIISVGIDKAWQEVRFMSDRFEKRGGRDYFK